MIQNSEDPARGLGSLFAGGDGGPPRPPGLRLSVAVGAENGPLRRPAPAGPRGTDRLLRRASGRGAAAGRLGAAVLLALGGCDLLGSGSSEPKGTVMGTVIGKYNGAEVNHTGAGTTTPLWKVPGYNTFSFSFGFDPPAGVDPKSLGGAMLDPIAIGPGVQHPKAIYAKGLSGGVDLEVDRLEATGDPKKPLQLHGVLRGRLGSTSDKTWFEYKDVRLTWYVDCRTETDSRLCPKPAGDFEGDLKAPATPTCPGEIARLFVDGAKIRYSGGRLQSGGARALECGAGGWCSALAEGVDAGGCRYTAGAVGKALTGTRFTIYGVADPACGKSPRICEDGYN